MYNYITFTLNRHAVAVMNVFGIIVIVVLYCIPESLPWLIKNGRHEEAFKLLQKIALSRNEEFTKEDYDKIASEDEEEVEEKENINIASKSTVKRF